jgi:hypothetical protein
MELLTPASCRPGYAGKQHPCCFLPPGLLHKARESIDADLRALIRSFDFLSILFFSPVAVNKS